VEPEASYRKADGESRLKSCKEKKVLLVSSVLGKTPELVVSAIKRFSTEFGDLVTVSEELPFRWTRYYQGELGETPSRRFIAIKTLVDPTALPSIKRASSRIETALSEPGSPRRINIDPGYLNQHQLVLASTKRRGHRIYLDQGIFADLMLLFGEEGFIALPWTYPDYAEENTRVLFDRYRDLYLSLLRTRKR
jgi:hypothetical protein